MGLGADLEPETLVAAYRQGIFPWPHPDGPLPWFCPDPRAVIDLLPAADVSGQGVHVSRSLASRLRRCGWTTTVNRAFGSVLDACGSNRSGGTWIIPEMKGAFRRLKHRGWANSVEVWDGDNLIGGIYGVRVGACFTGESMFHRVTDASKVALADLAWRWAEAGGEIIDVQMATEHLLSLGATEIPRSRFLSRLDQLRDREVCMLTERLPVSRLVG
ncbi:MAG: leucyl/phenylalanyl-tRNA--protein transferase [Acidimicrobiales bacterium]